MTRYVFPILLVILSLAIYGLYIEPLYGEIQRAQLKKDELVSALNTANTAQQTLDEIVELYQTFPVDAEEKLAQILPEKIDPIRLLIDSTAFLEKNGFSAKSLSVSTDSGGEDSDSAPYRTHTITFSISASYDTFREFLRVLEKSLVLRDPSSVSFSVGSTVDVGTKPELAIHTYNLKIVGYSLH